MTLKRRKEEVSEQIEPLSLALRIIGLDPIEKRDGVELELMLCVL